MGTRQDWFTVHNNLIDRQDLTIYEKMCCIVLARYADRAEFDNLLTLDVIANKMGCDKQSAERALFGLMTKGLLDLEDSGDGKIIHPESGQELKIPVFESMTSEVSTVIDSSELPVEPVVSVSPAVSPAAPEQVAAIKSDSQLKSEKAVNKPVAPDAVAPTKTPKKEKTKIAVNSDEFLLLLDQVYDIVQEKINEREARIILNFADHDLDLIREKYAIAKKTQISDKIEVLINELQKKPGPKASIKTAKGDTDTSESPKLATIDSQVNTQPGGQLNLVNINKMKLYKEMASQADQLKSKGK